MVEGNAESVCVLRRTYEESELLLVFVTGTEPVQLDLSQVTLGGETISADTQIRAMLTANQEQIVFEDGIAGMPGFSILVLK